MRAFIWLVSLLLIVAGAGWLAFPHVKKDARPYIVYSTDQLTKLVNSYQAENELLEGQIAAEKIAFDNQVKRGLEDGSIRADGRTIDEPVTLQKKRMKLLANLDTAQKMWSELAIRRYHLKEVSYGLIALGVALPLLMMLLIKLGVGSKTGKNKVIFQRLPDEQRYVSEYQYETKKNSGFESEKLAVEWLGRDPFDNCDYCGAKLNLPDAGQIQKVRFLREVPEGAIDQQVVLGELYFTKGHERATCPSCGKLVERK